MFLKLLFVARGIVDNTYRRASLGAHLCVQLRSLRRLLERVGVGIAYWGR